MKDPFDLISLFDLPQGQEGTVDSSTVGGEVADRELALRLFEIGFVEGERVRVVAKGFPGGEPIAVRVGGTIFALRRFEAERVMVSPLASERAKS